MAIRRPLVIDSGRVRELPAGDSLDASETPIQYAVPVAAEYPNPTIVFDSTGDVVLVLRGEGEL